MSKITPSLAKFINTSLQFANHTITNKVGNQAVDNSIDLVFSKLIDTVNAFSDENENDKEQIRLIWKGILAEPRTLDLLKNQLDTAVLKITDENIKNAVSVIINPVVATVGAMSDENTANNEQLQLIWIEFIKSPEFIKLLEDNLEFILSKVIKNDELTALIVQFITMFLNKK